MLKPGKVKQKEKKESKPPVLVKKEEESMEEEQSSPQFRKNPFDGATEEIMEQLNPEGAEGEGSTSMTITIEGENYADPVEAVKFLMSAPGVKEAIKGMISEGGEY